MSLIDAYLRLVASVLLLSLVFFPFEVLWAAEKNQPITKRLFNLAYVPFFLALAILVVQPIANLIATGVFVLTGGGTLPRIMARPTSIPGQLVFVVGYAVWWDVWQYWLHRLQHRVPWLWETHKFHHSETALNSSTQARHHLLHHMLTFLFYVPVLVVVGPYTPHYLAVFLMFRLWGFVNHANLRVRLGAATPLISGPQWHRIHHSLLAEHQDKNFATFFPFIDQVFGTYYRPLRDEFPPTGLRDEEPRPLNEATVGPLVAWLRHARTFLNRVDATATNES
jgi:sterol desaturase/sphingolipid hydroxylase (fatty acid hydroxylase superfamily)